MVGAVLEVCAEGVGRANTRKAEMLEVWFAGARECVTVTAHGWWLSAAGPRHKGDAYHARAGHEITCAVLDRVSYRNEVDGVVTEFSVEGVRVPLPGTATALCVDVVFVEFASPAECATGVTVYRRKAFGTVVASGSGAGAGAARAPLVATYDVPLILRPNALVPSRADPQNWTWVRSEHAYQPSASEMVWAAGFTLARGEVRLTRAAWPAAQIVWRAPIDVALCERVFVAYCAHRDALSAWAHRANWKPLGEACSRRRPDLPERMCDVPVWFPSRIAPHVPGVMAVDPTVSAFDASEEWWHAQVCAVLLRARVSEREFAEEWGADQQRTACVAMRSAKLWACSRMYATDWMTVPRTRAAAKDEYVENDPYNDLRVQGAGDCDDYALCVYRAFRALGARTQDASPIVRKAAAAAAQYVPFLCSGLYHDTRFAQVPDLGAAVGGTAPQQEEHAHAFVVAFHESWCRLWLSSDPAEAFPHEHQPLIGDGTCWPDPCMDGGAQCALEKFAHEFPGVADMRADLVRQLARAAEERGACDATDAFAVPFVEAYGTTRPMRGQFQMHDCVISLLSCVPSERGLFPGPASKQLRHAFQFRARARPNEAAGKLDDILCRPEAVRLEPAPAIPARDLSVFRDVLSLERPAPVMMLSHPKRAAMRAECAAFARELGVPENRKGTHTFALLVSTERFLARYPDVHVSDAMRCGEIKAVLRNALERARIVATEVRCDTGTELWIGLHAADSSGSSSRARARGSG